MLGVLFAAISACANGIKSVIHRHVMKTESVYAYALITQFFTAALFLPLALIYFELPTGITPWLILLASAILWTAYAVIGFASYKHTHVTIREAISQSRLILVFILSIILLSEKVYLAKVLGIIIIFGGVILLTYHKEKSFGSIFDKGVRITLLSAILLSFTTIIDKLALNYFKPEVYGFLVYLIPGIILMFFFKGKWAETKTLLTNKTKFIIIFIVLELISYYTYLKAFALEEVSIVFPILRLSTLITIILGMIFFEEERVDVTKKIIAGIIIIIGAILISGKLLLF